jgi:DNA-binding response OmpR family regulator
MLLKKIVVAEDDDGIAHMLGAALGDAGYLCLRARDGEEALALVRAQVPDALILDVMMPKLSGIDVVRRLKSDVMTSQVPVLMLTSLSDVGDKVIGLDAGADDYLTKPFDLRELRARVRALIRQSRRERDRDPDTKLPGVAALEEHVERLMASSEPFAIAYLEVEGHHQTLEQDGFVAARALARRLGDIVLDRSRGLGFAAHVGSGDFVIVASLAAVRAMAAEIKDAYDEALSRETGGQGMTSTVRALIVDGAGAKTVDELASRIARSRSGGTPLG